MTRVTLRSSNDNKAATARGLRRISRTSAFSEVVRDHMSWPPPLVTPDTACQEIVRLMHERPTSCVLISTGAGRPRGIVTERDVARKMSFQVGGSTPVRELMSSPVFTIREDDYLFHAIATMRRRDLRHMPAVDRNGRVVGMLDLHVALAAASSTLMQQIDRLTHEETLDGLHQVKSEQVAVAEALFAEEVPAPEIQGLLTQINNDIYRRVLELVLRDLEQEGWGGAPVEFCAIVMGSGGRGESFLFPDQDNGFVLVPYPDEQHGAVDAFFIELAERMTRSLAQVGIRLCNGFVMATNPLWRKTLPQWGDQIRYWLRRPNPLTLRLADIFFDFRSVFGEHGLADALRADVTGAIKGQHGFLREMQRVQADHGVALGLFGRLVPDRESGPHQGKLNLKYHGLLPLVEAIRLLALREGIAQTGTLARIAALHERSVLDANEQDYLGGGFHHLTRLVLRQQIADFKAGRAVSAYVPPRSLSLRERDILRDALHAIDALRQRVKAEFTAAIF